MRNFRPRRRCSHVGHATTNMYAITPSLKLEDARYAPSPSRLITIDDHQCLLRVTLQCASRAMASLTTDSAAKTWTCCESATLQNIYD